jgi:anti-sigma regulatory factor (Ser/Thr protein kinase)
VQDLSLHILDVAENSIAAGAKNVAIRLSEDLETDTLTLEIEDDGKGMAKWMLKKATDPFVTGKQGKQVGLGLALLSQAAAEANGLLKIESEPGKGTLVRATFQYSHVDRKPIGNLGETLTTLICGHPEIDFTFYHKGARGEEHLSTKEIKKRLGQDCLDYIDAAREVRRKLQ